MRITVWIYPEQNDIAFFEGVINDDFSCHTSHTISTPWELQYIPSMGITPQLHTSVYFGPLQSCLLTVDPFYFSLHDHVTILPINPANRPCSL